MAKIREDLVGVVDAGEHALKAGDTVPDGVTVGDHVLAAEKPAPKDEPAEDKPKTVRRTRKTEE